MKTETQKLGEQLGELLKRGNGGSWEGDLMAIRKAAPDWIDRKSWSGDSIAEIASRFAAWVVDQVNRANAADVVVRIAGTRLHFQPQPDGSVLISGPETFPRMVVGNEALLSVPVSLDDAAAVAPVVITWDLTLLNNRNDDSTAADRCPVCKSRDCIGAEQNLPCPICNGVEGCDHTRNERSAAASAGGLGDVLGVHTIPDPPPVRYVSDTDPESESARFCAACLRYFVGPAKMDARFDFCGDECQSKGPANVAAAEPAGVTLHAAASMPNQIEDLESIDNAGEDVKDRNAGSDVVQVKCEQCNRIVPSPDTFIICRPKSASPQTLCSVKCVAAALGIEYAN